MNLVWIDVLANAVLGLGCPLSHTLETSFNRAAAQYVDTMNYDWRETVFTAVFAAA